MSAIPYYELPGLQEVYFEDSYVLEVVESPTSLRFILELVLTEQHPLYQPPLPNEQYCYRSAWLDFLNIRALVWLQQHFRPTRDLDGTVDYGNIDSFYKRDDCYELEGDWGAVQITAANAPLLTIHQNMVDAQA